MIFLVELAFKSDRLLGWEGDQNTGEAIETGRIVSNPLGWEGDRNSFPRPRRPVGVSNPLGWEGDRPFKPVTADV